MDLNTWLKEPGRSSALADHCGVTPAAVSQWKSSGVPLRHVRKVSDFTAGEVTVDEIVSAVLNRAEESALKAAA